MPTITASAAKTFVEKFWSLHKKDAESPLADLYAMASSSFTTSTKRAEPARLVAMRRQREYFQSGASIFVDIRNLEVFLIEPNAAVVHYTLHLTATKKKDSGSVSEEVFTTGRVTQVLAFDDAGQLRIVHEHASVPEKEA